MPFKKGVYYPRKNKYNPSEKTKEKIKQTLKKRFPNGKPLNSGNFKKGFRQLEETKKKISINNGRGMLGKHHSEETKKKMSLRKKGIKNPKHSKRMIGRKLSKETRLKISNALKGEKSHFWKGGIHKNDNIQDLRRSIEYCLWREDVLE